MSRPKISSNKASRERPWTVCMRSIKACTWWRTGSRTTKPKAALRIKSLTPPHSGTATVSNKSDGHWTTLNSWMRPLSPGWLSHRCGMSGPTSTKSPDSKGAALAPTKRMPVPFATQVSSACECRWRSPLRQSSFMCMKRNDSWGWTTRSLMTFIRQQTELNVSIES